MKILKKIWNNFEEFFLIVTFIAILITVFLQVVSRIIGMPLMFTEELARYLFLWMIMLGFGFATKHEIQLKLEVLPNLPAKIADAVYFIMHLVALLVSIYMIKESIPYINFSRSNIATALQIPMSTVYLCLPIGFAINCVRHVELIIKRIIKITRKDDAAIEGKEEKA